MELLIPDSRLTLLLSHVISFTLKMEATCSSETSDYNKPTRHRIPEDGILQSNRRDNLKSCSMAADWKLWFRFPARVEICLFCTASDRF
jgi:hypothetical protein